jgi:hypothetical protein
MKNLNSLLAFIFASLLLLSGCKKDESKPTPTAPYVPVNIKGKWILKEVYDKTTTSFISYPETLDSARVIFKELSQFDYKGPCNNGSGFYLITESLSMRINDFIHSSGVCSTTTAIWEGRLFSGLKQSYHFSLSNNNTIMRIYSAHTVDLIFTKVS